MKTLSTKKFGVYLLTVVAACALLISCDTFKQDAIPTQKLDDKNLVVLPNSSAVVNLREGLTSFGTVTVTAAKSPTYGSLMSLNDYVIKYQASGQLSGSTDQFVYNIYDNNNELVGQRTYNVTVANDTSNLPCGMYSFPDSVTTGENEPITINVLDNDVFCSISKNDLVFGMDLPASHGLTEIDYPVIRYYPSTIFRGTDQFVYTLMDKSGVYASAIVTINVGSSGLCPFQAVGDKYDLADSAALSYKFPVQLNDRKCNGTVAGFSIINAPLSGTANIFGDLILYTPSTTATGFDSLRYEVCSAATGECSRASVVIKLK